jgi:hypothetical protein
VSAPDPAEQLPATIDALATAELDREQRRHLVRRLARQMPKVKAWRPGAAVRWLVDAVGEVAPHVPVRDGLTLQRHHHGLTGQPLADRLIRNAARATAGVGAACGGLAAISWVTPPALLSAPVLLGAETVAVVAIEMKLIGELHAAYGVPIVGSARERAAGLLQSWAHQRSVNSSVLTGAGVAAALGVAARKELTDRLARRLGGNLPTLAPLLAGAAAASFLNQRATRALGRAVSADLWRYGSHPGVVAR